MAVTPTEHDHRVLKRVVRALVVILFVFAASTGTGWAWFLYRTRCFWSQRHPGALTCEQLEKIISLQKTEDGLDLWKTPRGSTWTVHGERELPFLISEQERDIYELPGHAVHRGDVVLDCGANIGVFVRKALSRGASLVVAIEPSPRTLQALRRNFESEIREKRVIVYPKGVWDRDAELSLSLDVENEGTDSVVSGRPGSTTVLVPLTTIDKLVAELGLPRVDFIKMDIEGAEKQALRGGQDTIRRFLPRMSISTEHLPDDVTAIPAAIRAIEPRYAFQECDCMLSNRWTAKPLVLAFDAAPR
jgi:FkbM family methyltransferase